MSVFDTVVAAVFNHDRIAVGLTFSPIDLADTTQHDFNQYVPSYDMRLDLIAYEMCWIIYRANNEDCTQFEKFIIHDARGVKLFSQARKMARFKLAVNVTFSVIKSANK